MFDGYLKQKVEGKRRQIVDIYYNGVGIIHTPTVEENESGDRSSQRELREQPIQLEKPSTIQEKAKAKALLF